MKKHVEKFENYQQVKENYDSKEFNDFQKNFEKFAKELEVLSKKHGIAIQAIGGVSYGDIVSINYEADLSSGDLIYDAKWED